MYPRIDIELRQRNAWRNRWHSLLRTHPETADRIERLLALQSAPVEPVVMAAPGNGLTLLGVAFLRRPRWRVGGLWH